MPRTRKQNEKLREDRRRTVLQAAVTHFARDGFDGTSTGAVARAAGVSQATVFVYFPTKEELFRAAVLEPLPPTLFLVEQLLTGPGSPRDRLTKLAQAMLTSFAREESYLRLTQYVSHLRDRFPEVAGELMTFTTSVTGLIARVIAEGQAEGTFLPGDPTRQALLFSALINGAGLMHPAPADDPFWQDGVQAALRLILAPNT